LFDILEADTTGERDTLLEELLMVEGFSDTVDPNGVGALDDIGGYAEDSTIGLDTTDNDDALVDLDDETASIDGEDVAAVDAT
jgi:hypothetical protein